MKEINEEDNQKIINFMEISKINDKELAKNYLSSFNWNETQALNHYFSKNDINNNNLMQGINSNTNKNKIEEQNKSQNNNSNNNNNNESFFSKYIISPIMSLFSSCVNNSDSEYEEDTKIFLFLPNKVKEFSKFNQLIKKYLGIIIFYERNNLEYLKDLINKICRNSSLMNILKQKCVIFPVLSSSSNGFRIQDIHSDSDLLCPSFLFCHNKSNENIFDKDDIIELINGEYIVLSKFYSSLMNSLSEINKDIKLNENNQENNEFNSLTDAEILQKQKNDMEQLEKNVQEFEEEIKIQNIKKKEQLEKIEKMAEEFRQKFEKEPDENNPDCCTICFRYPDGEKTKIRRFMKTDTIKELYEYIKSLGNEIYTEDGNGIFSLYQPFPPKKYENMENTLENEGLFPNAVIQIKEE